MRVATWNVLHRFHAQNWDEPAIEMHPDETARIDAITGRLEGLDDGVICLQEVSGDQLASIRLAMPDDTIFVHTYPRVPKLFRPGVGPPPLQDPTEHLVTIVRGLGARRSEGHTFPDDKGKGLLLVELASSAVVINTHVSYGEHHVSQCAQLASYAAGYRGPIVILGDFNEERDVCLARLASPGFVAAVPREPARPTRPRAAPSAKSQTIDHIFVARTHAYEVEVLAGGGLSDHNPVVATIR